MKHLGAAAAATVGAVAASYLTLQHGVWIGVIGGVAVGALVGLVVSVTTSRKSQQ